ncbi:Uncharacterized protein TCM_029317 [Theobroma cacao]|uniref:Uncharacterized protein n=1 Tax=Theobroma cacao TaxID=3641 RepID=A0A061GDI5_THECC|nr:Uncharacterized protein TCM_029317 [Theobroma cacao]
MKAFSNKYFLVSGICQKTFIITVQCYYCKHITNSQTFSKSPITILSTSRFTVYKFFKKKTVENLLLFTSPFPSSSQKKSYKKLLNLNSNFGCSKS